MICDRYFVKSYGSECFEQDFPACPVREDSVQRIRTAGTRPVPTTRRAIAKSDARRTKTFVSIDPSATNDRAVPPRFFLCRCCDVVDTDGDGLVHVDDIVRNFRSHAHPEVADGSREEEDVRREFLESFSGKLGAIA